jgi:hypothetical protein
VDRQRRDGAVGRGRDAELWAGHDVAGREDVAHRGVVRVVDLDVPVLVAHAPELRAEVVGRVLPDGVEDLLAPERRAVLELQRPERALAQRDPDDRIGAHLDVERGQLGLDVGLRPERLAVGADDDLARPGGQVERHPHGLASLPEDHGLLVARIVAVAVGADVRAVAVDLLEPRDPRPDVLEPDPEQNPPRDQRLRGLAGLVVLGAARRAGSGAVLLGLGDRHRIELEHEPLVVLAPRPHHEAVEQRHAVALRLLAPGAPQLGRPDSRQPEVAVDAPSLPIAGIARIDEHDVVQIAAEPDGGREPGGTAADDGDVVDVRC